jgi:hypothetical protein
MDPNLVNATLGAPAAPANTLGASMYNEISQLGAIDRKLPTSTGLSNESLGIASDQVAAAKKAAADAAQREQDQQDINKYRAGHMENGKFVPSAKQDGGFDFFAPDGSQVDIATISKKTGVSPSEYLAKLGSKNPIDIQYIEQQKHLEKYMNAKLGGDKKTAEAYEKSDPALKNFGGPGGPQKLIEAFQKSFRRYYVPRSQDPNAWGAANGSNLFSNPAGNSGYGVDSSNEI